MKKISIFLCLLFLSCNAIHDCVSPGRLIVVKTSKTPRPHIVDYEISTNSSFPNLIIQDFEGKFEVGDTVDVIIVGKVH